MTEDVAHHFDVGPSINLSTRMTVPKNMCANQLGRYTSQPRVMPDAVTNGGTGHPLVGHIFPQKDMLHGWGRRPFLSYVGNQCFGDCGQQGKLDADLGFWPPRLQYAGSPIHVLQSQCKNFSCTQTVGGEQQHNRKVAFTGRL